MIPVQVDPSREWGARARGRESRPVIRSSVGLAAHSRSRASSASRWRVSSPATRSAPWGATATASWWLAGPSSLCKARRLGCGETPPTPAGRGSQAFGTPAPPAAAPAWRPSCSAADGVRVPHTRRPKPWVFPTGPVLESRFSGRRRCRPPSAPATIPLPLPLKNVRLRPTPLGPSLTTAGQLG
jgi:hypothetical protein